MYSLFQSVLHTSIIKSYFNIDNELTNGVKNWISRMDNLFMKNKLQELIQSFI
jgi:hypothetical protein